MPGECDFCSFSFVSFFFVFRTVFISKNYIKNIIKFYSFLYDTKSTKIEYDKVKQLLFSYELSYTFSLQ